MKIGYGWVNIVKNDFKEGLMGCWVVMFNVFIGGMLGMLGFTAQPTLPREDL